MTEIKVVAHVLRGTDNGPWLRRTDSGEWEPVPNSGRDCNPHHQAVATADALGDWLWNNRRLYSDRLDQASRELFNPWPALLVISAGSRMRHELPDGPSSRYGMWYFSVEEWARSVAHWRPRKPRISLIPEEMRQIAGILTLEQLDVRPTAENSAT